MPEKVTSPLMRFTSQFYQDDVRRGVAEILRRRAIQAEIERAAEKSTHQDCAGREFERCLDR